MRVGLVSPYSYSYPGGVIQHVEALTRELIARGHDARLLAPYDPDDRLARIAHRGARPVARPIPDYLIPLGRTVGLPANGAVSNLSFTPYTATTIGREIRHGGYDVFHVHEPNAPVTSWLAADFATRVPLVTTFHTYDPRLLVGYFVANVPAARRIYNRAEVRIAVSAAARWTAERFYGGRYRIIPNGVDLTAAPAHDRSPSPRLRLLFLGRADERKGLPVLLGAFDALRAAGVDAGLTIAGSSDDEVAPHLFDAEAVSVVGRVSEEEKWRLLAEADILCAPSLGGESFGMVLTEAFAAGTPVVCSDIAGYRDVVRAGRDGVLVPAGDAAALGEALLELAHDGARRERMGKAARERAERFAWPQVAAEVEAAYDDAIEVFDPAPGIAVRLGLRPADGHPTRPPQRLASLDPPMPGARRRRIARLARRGATAAGIGLAAWLATIAIGRIGLQSIADALLAATPTWILVTCGLMCAALFARAESWHAILVGTFPGVRVRRRDAARGLMIGVLMSATLPARLGELSRALVVAGRLGRPRQRLSGVLAAVVLQTLLNIVALIGLGAIMLATVGLFEGQEAALVVASSAPVLLLASVLASPVLLRGRAPRAASLDSLRRSGHAALDQVREALVVFRREPRRGAWAAVMQIGAWAIQCLACYSLLVALGLDHQAGFGAAAAVLFAVNVTSALPATPANVGVFQAACVVVLSAYGVGHTAALAYGIILQAVEIATAFALGAPALVAEGTSWRDLRRRALHYSPVELSAARGRSDPAGA